MKKLLCLLFASTSIFSTLAQDAFEGKIYLSSNGDTIRYRELTPSSMSGKKKFPLVLFLHGAGERGSDNLKQMKHGSSMFLNPVNRESFPAFVLMPQCPESGYWSYDDRPASFVPTKMPDEAALTPVFAGVKELLDAYLERPDIDKKRIYIMGLSMGAMGTYDMVSRFPELFAAAIPICGTVNPERLTRAKDVSFRIFHGDADQVVPVEGSREAYKALKKAGANVEYIEYPGCNHGSWNPAFSEKDFMHWLFKQKR
ncbi:MAG: prolyl oligopeptidase family serine peptidase [Bacteroidales bacterium]